LRVDDAVLSLLAGDVFGGSPIGWRLALFKFFYYANSLGYLTTIIREWWARRRGGEFEVAG